MSVKKHNRYTAPLYKRKSLRFRCTQCGACCSGGPEYQVWLEKGEPEKIRVFLGLSRSWLYRRYIARLADGESVLRSTHNGDCVFLDEEGKCRIYPVRPMQCSSYPFWPEVVTTSRAWNREARRCEGINQGSPVSIKKIEDLLAIQMKKSGNSRCD